MPKYATMKLKNNANIDNDVIYVHNNITILSA